eukprot:scaffold75712_cov29-Tisochrysis_lutea.AAC.1
MPTHTLHDEREEVEKGHLVLRRGGGQEDPRRSEREREREREPRGERERRSHRRGERERGERESRDGCVDFTSFWPGFFFRRPASHSVVVVVLVVW